MKTLEQIRAALPTHIMLTPGVHRWREGDEECLTQYTPDGPELYWSDQTPSSIGSLIGLDEVARRPAPPRILDNQAWWVWYNGRVDEISNKELRERHYGPEYNKRVNEGRLYDKWLLEQMEGG